MEKEVRRGWLEYILEAELTKYKEGMDTRQERKGT